MNQTIVKASGLIMWGQGKQKMASLTGNNKLYLSGKRDEWMGKTLKQYGKIKDFFAH